MPADIPAPAAPEDAEGGQQTLTMGGASPAAKADSHQLPAAIGRYRILRLLGEGGMGAVYEAEQEQPRRTVALKVIKTTWASSELLRRFEQESQALGRLHHPGIAQVYEAGTADSGFGVQPFFAMELIHGKPLCEYAEANHLDVRKRLALMIQVCDAVQHAHQRGIIHRDLKPGNILVDENGQPKILDFGLARVTDSDAQATRQTDMGQLLGTLAYMSPEQVLADPLAVDTRSDVYALGVIFYELLARKLPYTLTRHLHEAVQTIRQQDPAALSSVSRTYRGDIETIVTKALEKDKERRYASAADLASDIRRHLDNQPISAIPPSTAYQLQKFVRRHKALVAGIAAVFVALLAGVTASTWEAARARSAEKSALAAQQVATRERDRAVTSESQAEQDRNRAVASESQAVRDRNIAVEQKKRADTAAATSAAVNDFLQNDLLAQASNLKQAGPGSTPDPDIKIRTALDRAAARIEGKFPNQPLVEASIRQTIGRTYTDLGVYAEAERQFQRAVDLKRQALGPDHADTLDAQAELGTALYRDFKYAQAEPFMTKTVESLRRLLGENDRKTLNSINVLGFIYMYQKKYAQAEPLLTGTLELERRLFGDDDLLTLDTIAALTAMFTAEGRYAEAEKLLVIELEARRRVFGAENPSTVGTMNNLAVAYTNDGQYAQAEQLLLQVMEIQARVRGVDHPNRLATMSNLAVLYAREEKYEDAEQLLTKALEARRRTQGQEHPATLITMNSLAVAFAGDRKFEQAETLLTNLAEIRRRVLGPLHADTLNSLTWLGYVRLQLKKCAEAEPPLREALAGLDKTTPNDWRRFSAESMLGESLAGQDKYAEAEPLLLSGRSGLIERQSAIPATSKYNLENAGTWIVQLYENWGKPEKAAEWKQRLLSQKPAPAKQD